MKKKILISGANGPIMRSLILILRKKGFYIIGIDASIFGNAESFCDEFYKCPNGKDKNFLRFLNKFSNKVDAVYLYVDEELENVSKNIKNFPDLKKKLIISPPKTIKICNNKNVFYNFFKYKKIKLPLINLSRKNIIKPNEGRGGKNIFTTNDKSIIKLFKKKSKYLVQEFISGKEYSVDCVFDKKNILIFGLVRQRVVSQNVSIVGKILRHKKIITRVREISVYLKFYGPINFQFIENKKGIWLIEINPRLSGSIIFSIMSGFNPIIMSYQIHKNQKIYLPKKIQYNKTHFRFWNSISQ
jgi:carbamoyl-phosphate synthase large subunit